MSVTLTPDESGNYEVSHQGERQAWHRGINAVSRDEFSGEIVEEDVYSHSTDGEYEAVEAFGPDVVSQHAEEIPLLKVGATDAEINAWLMDTSPISDLQFNQIVQGMEANGLDGNSRDFICEVLSVRQGDIPLGMASEEVQELFAQAMDGEFTPQEFVDDETVGGQIDEILAGLSDETLRTLEQQVDEETQQDVLDTGTELLQTVANPADAEMFGELAETAYRNGDTEGALLYALSQHFHSGRMSAQEAVQEAINRMGLSNAYNSYLRLNGVVEPGELTFGRSSNQNYR